MYNRSHGMLDLSLFMTHVVVAIMLSLNYIMTHFFSLVKHFGRIHLLPQFVLLYLKLYVKESHENFYNKRCVGGNKCDNCGTLAFFYHKYPIDINNPSLSDIIVYWKRYEYFMYSHNSISSSNALSERIDLQEDKISVTEFLKKFGKKL